MCMILNHISITMSKQLRYLTGLLEVQLDGSTNKYVPADGVVELRYLISKFYKQYP